MHLSEDKVEGVGMNLAFESEAIHVPRSWQLVGTTFDPDAKLVYCNWLVRESNRY